MAFLNKHNRPKQIPSVYAQELLEKLLGYAGSKFEHDAVLTFVARDIGVVSDRDDQQGYTHYLQALGTLVALNLLEENRDVSGNAAQYTMTKDSFLRLKKLVRKT